MPTPRMFLSPPHMGGGEFRFVEEAFASNYIAPLGPMVDAFEREFAEYTGIPHCLALSSGTAAMHLAVREALRGEEVRSQKSGVRSRKSEVKGQGRGRTSVFRPPTSDRPVVLASTLTFIGSVTPATYEGCELRFIDCDRETWNMDPFLLQEELADLEKEGRRPSAVIPTDLYGQCCNLPKIVGICDRYRAPVICDSAEAVGARYKVSGVGCRASGGTRQRAEGAGGIAKRPTSWAHAGYGAWAAVYSFNGNKIITTSGGGMLASHDKALVDRARKLAAQARDPAPWYEHSEIGFNYRMSNIVAAIGRGQLQALDDRVRRRREIFAAYRRHLAKVPGISFMPEPDWSYGNRWLTVILIGPGEFGTDTHAVREALERENIEARPLWKPMHLQPVFGECRVRTAEHGVDTGREAVRRHACNRTAVSEDLFARGLCLPSGSAMKDADISRVVRVIRQCARRCCK